MSEDKRRERILEKIAGLELAIELETAVMAHLQPTMDRFDEPGGKGDMDTLRRVRQYCKSRDDIRGWREEIDDLRAMGPKEWFE